MYGIVWSRTDRGHGIVYAIACTFRPLTGLLGSERTRASGSCPLTRTAQTETLASPLVAEQTCIRTGCIGCDRASTVLPETSGHSEVKQVAEARNAEALAQPGSKVRTF